MTQLQGPRSGTSFGRGGATTFQQGLAESDCILIMGSNMAENHPVGFQWVMEARELGAEVIHVDPRFTRTSAMATSGSASAPALTSPSSAARQLRAPARAVMRDSSSTTRTRRSSSRRGSRTPRISTGSSPAGTRRATNDIDSWSYEGMEPHSAAGKRETRSKGEAVGHGAAGKLRSGEPPAEDRTLQHPRCIFQLLRALCPLHAGAGRRDLRLLGRGVRRRGREAVRVERGRADERDLLRGRLDAAHRRRADHPHGRRAPAAAGNIGRPGGGILALRGHASIQGSTDIPTLYNILPGYLPVFRKRN